MSFPTNRPGFRPCLCKMPHTDIKTAHKGDLVGLKQGLDSLIPVLVTGTRGVVLQVQVRVHLKMEQVISDNWGGSIEPTWDCLKAF